MDRMNEYRSLREERLINYAECGLRNWRSMKALRRWSIHRVSLQWPRRNMKRVKLWFEFMESGTVEVDLTEAQCSELQSLKTARERKKYLKCARGEWWTNVKAKLVKGRVPRGGLEMLKVEDRNESPLARFFDDS
jgi:hypothetical protein